MGTLRERQNNITFVIYVFFFIFSNAVKVASIWYL